MMYPVSGMGCILVWRDDPPWVAFYPARYAGLHSVAAEYMLRRITGIKNWQF